ncbi:MAG: hypothetical protein AAF514_08535, partial [Verrucomicrobiota bacterium]
MNNARFVIPPLIAFGVLAYCMWQNRSARNDLSVLQKEISLVEKTPQSEFTAAWSTTKPPTGVTALEPEEVDEPIEELPPLMIP